MLLKHACLSLLQIINNLRNVKILLSTMKIQSDFIISVLRYLPNFPALPMHVMSRVHEKYLLCVHPLSAVGALLSSDLGPSTAL